MNSRALRAGIDLGGTKIAGVVLDASGIEVCRERVATPQGDYQLTLQALVGLVATLEEKAGQQCSVGIGMPGSVSRATGLVKNSNSVCLNGQPLHHDLEVLLVSVPAAVIDRDVRHARAHQPTRHRAGLPESIAPVTLSEFVLLLRQVEELPGVAEDHVVGFGLARVEVR